MHKNIFLVLLIGIIASCGDAKKDSSGALSDKKAALQELKVKHRELATEIATLEIEITKLDTSSSAAGKPKMVALEPVETLPLLAYRHFAIRFLLLDDHYIILL